MRQPLVIPGIAGRVEVEPPQLFAGPKLCVDGRPAPSGPKKGQYLLHRTDGTPVIAHFKGGFPDPSPSLVVGDQAIRLAEPLAWYEWAWAGLPLCLIFIGGAIGGGIGGMAMTVNAHIFRAPIPIPARYLISGMVTVIAIAAWLVIALAVQSRITR